MKFATTSLLALAALSGGRAEDGVAETEGVSVSFMGSSGGSVCVTFAWT